MNIEQAIKIIEKSDMGVSINAARLREAHEELLSSYYKVCLKNMSVAIEAIENCKTFSKKSQQGKRK